MLVVELIGKSQATLGQMQEWAKKRNASLLFIGLAELYVKYGELTGIRADVLYAQSAKETAFGRFGGAVTVDMNNFAGIKIAKSSGDKTSDHQVFATIEDGVRGHFNHICAYTGLVPVGEPHPRYYVVKSCDWAGTIKYVEELATRYCPNPTYSSDLINNFLKDLLNTPIPIDNEKDLLIRQLQSEMKLLNERLLNKQTEIINLKSTIDGLTNKIEKTKELLSEIDKVFTIQNMMKVVMI